mmetsp:Transcript_39357/g.84274  ORF Transcript_39357/g.84274 Transcript_39357/m.84274 type:complete len:135 (-) Transcript_39357:141-545(-)
MKWHPFEVSKAKRERDSPHSSEERGRSFDIQVDHHAHEALLLRVLGRDLKLVLPLEKRTPQAQVNTKRMSGHRSCEESRSKAREHTRDWASWLFGPFTRLTGRVNGGSFCLASTVKDPLAGQVSSLSHRSSVSL